MKVEVREVKPVQPPKEYVLTINQNELEIIVRAVGRIQGCGPWKPVITGLYDGLVEYSKTGLFEYSMLDHLNGHLKPDSKVLPV